MKSQYIEPLPVPEFDVKSSARVSASGETCQHLSEASYSTRLSFSRRIPDLCPPEREAKLSSRLENWHDLPDFAAFRAEVKKVFKADIPVKVRSDWEDLFVKGKAEIEELSAEIKRNEDEINAIVYKLFDLTPDEIALLEESIGAKKAGPRPSPG